MMNLSEFIALNNFATITTEELIEIVQNFEEKLCLGCAIDSDVIIAADLAKQELVRRQ